jgi:hypothetical protein
MTKPNYIRCRECGAVWLPDALPKCGCNSSERVEMRRSFEVVDQLLAVPTLPVEMRKSFEKVRNDLRYTAPEREVEKMVEINMLFNVFVPKPLVWDWQFDALAAFMNEPVESLRNRMKGN